LATEAKSKNKPTSVKVLEQTQQAARQNGFNVIVVDTPAQALEKLVGLISPGAEVMTGSSTTLEEIGFTDVLKSNPKGWKSLHRAISAESDAAKRAELRRKSVTAEFFVSSVNAITQQGELLACDASGSRVGAFPFAAKNLVIVSGVNKIVPTLQDAFDRLKNTVFPLEDARARKAYGMGSSMNKTVILSREMPGRVTLILVKQALGY